MANTSETQGQGGNGGLYFIVGILAAVVAGLVYVMVAGMPGIGASEEPGLSISITENGASVEATGGADGGQGQ